MIQFKKTISAKCKRLLFYKKSNRGAITVEYALGMVVATVFMMGVELMFRSMAISVINFFKQIVTTFPNI